MVGLALDEIYLRKVVGFFPHLGFSQDKSLVFSCLLFMLLFSVHDIIVNVKEVKEHW
jgi:hypothetical protein